MHGGRLATGTIGEATTHCGVDARGTVTLAPGDGRRNGAGYVVPSSAHRGECRVARIEVGIPCLVVAAASHRSVVVGDVVATGGVIGIGSAAAANGGMGGIGLVALAPSHRRRHPAG